MHTRRVLVCLSLALALPLARADILFYDGCPTGTGGYGTTDGAAIKDKEPTSSLVSGFSGKWLASTSVIMSYSGSLSFPGDFGKDYQSKEGNGKFGFKNDGKEKNQPRVQVRKLSTALTSANLSNYTKLYFRALLSSDQPSINMLTPAPGLTMTNTRGVGILHYQTPSYNGNNSLYFLMPTQSDRFVWLGINSHTSGKGTVECSIKGLDGTVQTATLIDADTFQAGTIYLVCAEIRLNANGDEIVRAFAQPTTSYDKTKAWVPVGSAALVDGSTSSLDCLSFGGAYQVATGATYFDAFCCATTRDEALVWEGEEEPEITAATLSGDDDTYDVTTTLSFANPPDTFTVHCMTGVTATALAEAKSWESPSEDSLSFSFAGALGGTYYAQWVLSYGDGKELTSSLMDCAFEGALTWTGAGDDATDWNQAANWTPNMTPTRALDATFSGANAEIKATGATLAAKDVTLADNATVALALDGDSVFTASSLTMVNGVNSLSVTGGASVLDGTLSLGNPLASNNNGSSVTFADGTATFGTLSLRGNKDSPWNTLTLSNMTATVGGIEFPYISSANQGRAHLLVKDSTLTIGTSGNILIDGMMNQIDIEDSKVTNYRLLRLGQAENSPNTLRLVNSTWNQASYGIVLARRGHQTLEVGTGSTLTLTKDETIADATSRGESGNIFLGHHSDNYGYGTLIVSNATLRTDAQGNIYAPRKSGYGKQVVVVHEDAGYTSLVACSNLYIGATVQEGSVPRSVERASELHLDGGTVEVARWLNIGAIYEVGGNLLDIKGETAHCTAELFSLTNASMMRVTVPAAGFRNTLVRATGKAEVSADSTITVDATAFKSGTVRLVVGDPLVLGDETLSNITVTPHPGSNGRLRLVKEEGVTVALEYVCAPAGLVIVIK